jgi:uncharacterized DUF497 family protein
MRFFTWQHAKNEKLKRERGISFEEVIFHILGGDLLDVLEHPNQKRHRGQWYFVVRIDDYAWVVPFLMNKQEVLLKTIIPSRKYTRRYLGKEKDDV